MRTLVVTLVSVILGGCSVFPTKNASWNERIEASPLPTKASFKISNRGYFDETLFVIASSGGGSRAAVFTANVLLKLQETMIEGLGTNLLDEVDAISAVSGGALPVAHYAIAAMPEESCVVDGADSKRPVWRSDKVRKRMKTNFERKWLVRWFNPSNAIRFWFSSYDRSDIMSQVFADSLYDRGVAKSYTFGDICCNRPNIIINATHATSLVTQDESDERCVVEDASGKFGSTFTFTDEEFRELDSSINNHSLSDAVMSSAAFPAVFNHTTLRNYARPRRCYVHLFDGGGSDNLGLGSAWEVIDRNHHEFKRVVVLLIDAYTPPLGVPAGEPDARSGFDYLVDMNFLDSVDALLTRNRESQLTLFKNKLEKLGKENKIETFVHQLTFDSVKNTELKKRLNRIKTRFKISDEEAEDLSKAVDELMSRSDPDSCFSRLKVMIEGGNSPNGDCDMLSVSGSKAN